MFCCIAGPSLGRIDGDMDVLCGKCGKSFSVDEKRSGPEVPCPHCHAITRLPTPNGATPPSPPPEESDGFLIKARLALKKKMLVLCPACSLRMIVRQKLSGKIIQCPACSHQVTVPTSFMPAESEALAEPDGQKMAPGGPVQAGFQMPAIAVYEDSSPVRWLAGAVAAIILSTAAGFATGYFVRGPAASPATVQPSAAPAAPANPEPAVPAAPENRLVR